MAKVEAFDALKQWALRYVRHRDIHAKKIAAIKDTDYGFLIANNDGTSASCTIALSFKGVSKEFISASAAGKSALVVTLSNEENIQSVYSVWDALAASQGLLIIFANPFSATEDKWVLKPFLHNKVCDRNSLLQGLKAMSELVEPIDEETLTTKLRNTVVADQK
ncbi:hypothetical protein HYY73_05315 [Candidatus Woesearchaeota archaeon]|nr:hypothetical protein [Candidatus Woesearchaeota archaeon]